MILLDAWLKKNSRANFGQEVTSVQRCYELSAIADKNDGRLLFPYKGKIKAFALWIRNIKTVLKEIYVIKRGGTRLTIRLNLVKLYGN